MRILFEPQFGADAGFFPCFMSGSWGYNRTGTSVADFNNDGYLDMISPGFEYRTDTITTYYFWDVQNNSVSKFRDPTYNWPYGAGRPNLADMDGDGQLEASFVSGNYLYCLDNDWTILWRVPITETTSGNTGSTVFDFNGDGASEVVYEMRSFCI